MARRMIVLTVLCPVSSRIGARTRMKTRRVEHAGRTPVRGHEQDARLGLRGGVPQLRREVHARLELPVDLLRSLTLAHHE